jgi:benzoate-CoA ligase family protein
MGPFAQVEPGTPPRVTFPAAYNAGVDLATRNLAAGAQVVYHDDLRTLTYAELAERAARVAGALAGLGVLPEQRVLLVLLDTVDFPAVFVGAMQLGAVPVPVNTLLTAADIAFLARDSRARLAVVSDALLPKLSDALAGVPLVVAGAGAGGAHPRLDDLLAAALAPAAPAVTTPDDVAFWLYSSGSTGAPKGVLHLHAHPMRTAALYAQGVLGFGPDDVVYSAAKLFFAYGLGNALTFPLAVGARAVLSAERPTPAVVARVMREHRPTLFFGVPTLFAALLADPSFTVSPALRLSVSAGEALPRHVGEAWRARFGTDILDGIGSTELLHIFLSARPGEVTYGTTGRPVPGYDVKIVDDDGAPVAAGSEGALWVRGPTAAVAYFGARERSLATFHGPWTRTGDRYLENPDGTFTYRGRTDDMLKVGGIWVSPFEVESAVAAHPAVLEAAVVGHPDSDGLIKPKAFVVLKQALAEPEAELRAFVKASLAPFKCPRWVEVVADLPKTATGKIQRFRLRTTR